MLSAIWKESLVDNGPFSTSQIWECTVWEGKTNLPFQIQLERFFSILNVMGSAQIYSQLSSTDSIT